MESGPCRRLPTISLISSRCPWFLLGRTSRWSRSKKWALRTITHRLRASRPLQTKVAKGWAATEKVPHSQERILSRFNLRWPLQAEGKVRLWVRGRKWKMRRGRSQRRAWPKTSASWSLTRSCKKMPRKQGRLTQLKHSNQGHREKTEAAALLGRVQAWNHPYSRAQSIKSFLRKTSKVSQKISYLYSWEWDWNLCIASYCPTRRQHPLGNSLRWRLQS